MAMMLGQRPSDMLKIHTGLIHNGILSFKQNKTSNPLRFKVTESLQEIITRRAPTVFIAVFLMFAAFCPLLCLLIEMQHSDMARQMQQKEYQAKVMLRRPNKSCQNRTKKMSIKCP